MITIRELADSCNISVRTLQYYDQIDLFKPSGYQGRIRLYDEAAKKKLKCILAWKVLGLSLEEITKRHGSGTAVDSAGTEKGTAYDVQGCFT